MFFSMFHGFHYTFQKARSIIKKITAAIDARGTPRTSIAAYFFEWRNKIWKRIVILNLWGGRQSL